MRAYTQGGLPALSQTIANDQAAGRREGLFVRVLGRHEQLTFLSMPGGLPGEFDLGRLQAPGWGIAPSRRQNVVLEVASVQLPDGTLIQVGKSTESREALLQRFRDVASLVTLTVVLIALVGGTVLTRSALRPVHHLIEAVRAVTRTGRMDARVPVRQTGDAVDEQRPLRPDARAHRGARPGHARRARQRRARPPHAHGAAARRRQDRPRRSQDAEDSARRSPTASRNPTAS